MEYPSHNDIVVEMSFRVNPLKTFFTDYNKFFNTIIPIKNDAGIITDSTNHF